VSTPIPGKTWVDPPPVDPYTYGLLSVSDVTTGTGPWQIGGVEYDTDACAQGGLVVGSCPVPNPTADLTAGLTIAPDPASGAPAFQLTAPAGNDFPVVWALVSTSGGPTLTGTARPGTVQHLIPNPPAGTYAFQVQAYGHPLVEAGDVTFPLTEPTTGTVTLTATGPGTSHDKPVAEGLAHVTSPGPFTVYARAECNAVGFDNPTATARRRIAYIENREVEHFFSRYVLGAAGARLPLGATAAPLKQALGALEADAALFYGGQPVLHSPRWTNPYFEDRHLLQPGRDTSPVLRTHLTSKVAFGGGYYDNPFNPAIPPTDGQFWLVATGFVRAWRSEVFVNETFTEATNLRMALAERTYLFDADCYRAAVLVSLTGEG